MSIGQQLNGRAQEGGLLAGGRFIYEALSTPAAALAYRVGEELAAYAGERALLRSSDCNFNVEGFARVGHCELLPHAAHHAEVNTVWYVEPRQSDRVYVQAWHRVAWAGAELELVRLEYPVGYGSQVVRWLIADSQEQAEAFFAAVCAWNAQVDEAILVFQDGYWQKNYQLYQAIKQATLNNLVLGGTLKEDLRRDLTAFFNAQAVYERAGVAWKRGIVLIGPPGNGKTHAIKALINDLDKPCLYVKSFSSEHADDHHNIRVVFEQARETAPCVLVLEDLDSLVTDHNRSFFLNELDGFAGNTGVVTIASTNHPEKLDPAIMARPSRFDRKYHFGLPGAPERRAYLELWSARVDAGMRPASATLDAVAASTDGFSFAYLKELLVAATVRWAEAQTPGAMDTIIPAELAALREQMSSAGMV